MSHDQGTAEIDAPGSWVLSSSAVDPAESVSPGGGAADTTIRVDVGVLDNLMTLVGELVLARNELLQLVSAQPDGLLTATAQRLSLITTELQEGAMKTRMQPFNAVTVGLPQLVAERSRAAGKEVLLEVDGEDTELDKSIIETLTDPLTLLVRHAVDHGIERAAVRLAAHKPAVARIGVRAYHEGGKVNIEIRDDGVGAPDDGAVDEARTAIERIGGSVDVHAVPGRGTTALIKIPLTLAIVPALFVASAGERFAIPQADVVELVRVPADEHDRIELIQGAPVYRLRGRLLPLVHLRDQLGRPDLPRSHGRSGRPDVTAGPETVTIVVLQADGHQLGLVVEGVSDSAEIVVKPLSPHLKDIAAYAGATIMGDGRIALILDVRGLADQANLFEDHHDGTDAAETATSTPAPDATGGALAAESLLLLSTAAGGRMAIPLAAVDRLEKFTSAAVEHVGSQDVVQYRDALLPLVFADRVLGGGRVRAGDEDPTGTIQVVVHEHGGRRVGIVVHGILDIVDEVVRMEGPLRTGVLGSIVIDGRATEVLDLAALLQAAVVNDHPAAGRRA